ncbi:MAG: hypothetical protein J0H80_20920 [Rhizobiales bacterium]|nr:hypothetical protein [Hyphomicrobiales bacterium]
MADLGLSAQPRDHARYIANWLKLCAALHNSSNREVSVMRRSAIGALFFL